MTNSGIKNNLKNMLFQRYQKLLLSYEEVQSEVLENPKLVESNSMIPNTWLIDDVVSYLCTPYEMSYGKHASNREKKQFVIDEVNKTLQKYWNKTRATEA